jgi:hypothetical protein
MSQASDSVTQRVNARFDNAQPISVGRIVHMQLDKADPYTGGGGAIRPALVVRVQNSNCVNLQVFFDGTNDDSVRSTGVGNHGQLTEWVTAVDFDAGEEREIDDPQNPGEKKLVTAYNPHTWHWPPRA